MVTSKLNILSSSLSAKLAEENILGRVSGTGFVIVAPSKSSLDRKSASPGPKKFIATPETV